MPKLSESRFNMWRAVIAMVHADHVVKPHEVNFILSRMRELALSEEQRRAIAEDIRAPKEVRPFFDRIVTPRDKEDFFHLARAVCWSDGEFNQPEREQLLQLAGLGAHSPEAAYLSGPARSFDTVYVGEDEADAAPSFMDFVRRLFRRG